MSLCLQSSRSLFTIHGARGRCKARSIFAFRLAARQAVDGEAPGCAIAPPIVRREGCGAPEAGSGSSASWARADCSASRDGLAGGGSAPTTGSSSSADAILRHNSTTHNHGGRQYSQTTRHGVECFLQSFPASCWRATGEADVGVARAASNKYLDRKR